MLRIFLYFLLLVNTTFCLAKTEKAIFAGGCFWCMEADFDHLPGVLSTTSGFDGDTLKDPTYEQVSAGNTHYAESVMVEFDSNQLSYKKLVEYFFMHIDPTVKNAQFCDHGSQYRSAIFYLNNQQKKIAMEYKKELEQKFPIVYTEIVPSTSFYPAEEYHQNYYKKNPIRYKYYRYRCGRDARVQEVWDNKKYKNNS
ncbi:TPA: peptide-methionine (S)-S-oxide reductase MsrA [Legionella pneumophila]|nr:peptide-methionine (S)-S-oxide reductase MsrA [Legionella pneumophila]MDW8879785.1 peptide-methionine (S)-S-oxide reductase MsrA [Legionella pneumophila subsp. fraseri]MDW8962725.1 peptide-methionine (S)-S-oxide reductase MsrA [Legionella pneumophila subsp. fraseri]MDW9035825.1 peptide-methionine (S)-S-oxide reductase MsrA [Legionella pneumophila subsp. fraseri]MDW9039326.1 peptide-methionine (S)-S-oxide reductase MsrA [Legionella pneumophila subsp. fraseri]MDW9042174.1 peptide-methionine (